MNKTDKKIILLGDPGISRKLEKKINHSPLKIETYELNHFLYGLPTDNVLGYMITSHTKDYSMMQLLKEIKKHPKAKKLPIYLFDSGDFSRDVVKDFYKKKATGVFSWKMSHELILRTLTYSLISHRDKTTLFESWRMRFKRFLRSAIDSFELDQKIRLRIVKNKIFLSGKASTLESINSLVDSLSFFPGVDQVDFKDLLLIKKELPDIQLVNRVKEKLSHFKAEDISKMSFKLKNNQIQLVGVLPSKDIKEKVLNSIASTKGLKEITDFTLVRNYPSSYESMENSLERKVKEQFHSVKDIDVSCSGDTVKIEGKVTMNSLKGLIEDFIIQHSPLPKIKNNLKTV